jgi:UDP-N-acetylglucosamine 1-carboxyvinyltransferase
MQEKFIIEGLCGAQTLEGTIPVYGAKNAVLKSIAASLLFEDTLTIGNVPHIEDVKAEVAMLTQMGAVVTEEGRTLKINTSGVQTGEIPPDLARKIRASVGFTGPLLSRMGRVTFPHPGGDVIGARPINLFIDGFSKMDATVEHTGDSYNVTATNGLHGAAVSFSPISVMATETLMMAAILANGTTTLNHAAREPEIVALANFLVECGAQISGAGTSTITIEGTNGVLLKAKGRVFETIPDRIETATFVLIGALLAKHLTVTNCNPLYVKALTTVLAESGVKLSMGTDTIEVWGCTDPKPLHITTDVYPGFATDMQSPMEVYLTQAKGESTVHEAIFENRLAYTKDLVRMGANIVCNDAQHATIVGPTALSATDLKSPDVRAGLAFLMAAALAKGTSTIEEVYHIDRGYEKIEERLQKIGLNINRVSK